jgi:uncharacterized cupin superfamily protein
VSYSVIHGAGHSWVERPPIREGPTRFTVDLGTALELSESRARLWRLPPGSRGRRHAEEAQEEVFFVVAGTLTMLLGDPPERVDLAPTSVVSVKPGTAIQMRNMSDTDVVVFAYGAPPVTGAEYLDDVEL